MNETSAYLLALHQIPLAIEGMRRAMRERVVAWEQEAKVAGVPLWKIIVDVLQPWNAWDQAVATLGNVTVINEILRVQAGGAIGDLSNFQPSPPPTLPAIPTASEVVTLPPPDVVPTDVVDVPPPNEPAPPPATVAGVGKWLALGLALAFLNDG